jgi:hypothetical protein
MGLGATLSPKPITVADMAPWELWFAKARVGVSEEDVLAMAENRLAPERVQQITEKLNAAFATLRAAQCYSGYEWWMPARRAFH